MSSILEALVVLFNIVKHRLHVCLELVAGQRGGGELCLERFYCVICKNSCCSVQQLAGLGPRLRGVVARASNEGLHEGS